MSTMQGLKNESTSDAPKQPATPALRAWKSKGSMQREQLRVLEKHGQKYTGIPSKSCNQILRVIVNYLPDFDGAVRRTRRKVLAVVINLGVVLH